MPYTIFSYYQTTPAVKYTYFAHAFHFKSIEVCVKRMVPFSQQWRGSAIGCRVDRLARGLIRLILLIFSTPQVLSLSIQSVGHLAAPRLYVCCRRLRLLGPGAQVVHHSLPNSNIANGINATKRGTLPRPLQAFHLLEGELHGSAVAGKLETTSPHRLPFSS